jgi:hypothetical protein
MSDGPSHDARLTIQQAQRLKGRFVYGLADGDGIFYVGQTRNPARRFEAHGGRRTNNTALRDRLGGAGADLRVVILRRNPGDLNAAEREEIRARSGTLVNLVGGDHWSWERHRRIPWAAGTGIFSPSAYAMTKTPREHRSTVRAALALLTDAERCVVEVGLLRDFPPHLASRFDGWLETTREKMIACMEAAYGAA